MCDHSYLVLHLLRSFQGFAHEYTGSTCNKIHSQGLVNQICLKEAQKEESAFLPRN